MIDPQKLQALYQRLPHLQDDEKYDDANRIALIEYYDGILPLAENGLNVEFNNKNADHAKTVMPLLFNHADVNGIEYEQGTIQMVVQDFNGDVCNGVDYIESLENALNKGIKVDVIFVNEPNTESRVYHLLNNSPNATLSQLNQEYKDFLEAKSFILDNFTVVGNAYRNETDTTHYKANCNFDDEHYAIILHDNFLTLKQNSIEIE